MTRDEAIQVLANFYVSNKNPKANHFCEAIYIAIQALKSEPTIEAEPKHGRWIRCNELRYTIDGRVFDGYSECSECGELYPLFPEYNFCPNCGSRMDGGEND